MQIRNVTSNDLAVIRDIDGTIESPNYLHLETTRGDDAGEGFSAGWTLEQRTAREKLIEPNRLDDDAFFQLKQIVSGADDGLALAVEHDSEPIAMLVAQIDAARGTLHILDLRVDYDYRRQGMGTALLYQAIGQAREKELRAISMQTLTNNLPAAALLKRCGFELSGVDTRRRTNHDLVKEAVTLFWYAPLD